MKTLTLIKNVICLIVIAFTSTSTVYGAGSHTWNVEDEPVVTKQHQYQYDYTQWGDKPQKSAPIPGVTQEIKYIPPVDSVKTEAVSYKEHAAELKHVQVASTSTTSSPAVSTYSDEDFVMPKRTYKKYAETESLVSKDEIREQTVESVSGDLKIEQYFYEAKAAELMTVSVPPKASDDVIPDVMTDEMMVRSVMKPEALNTKMDLEFDEVRLADIFMTLGKAADVNVLVDPALKDRLLDLHLKQVSITEAFILIANAYDLGFKKVENSLFVTSKDKVRQENLVTKVFRLRNIQAEDVKMLVHDMIGTVNVSEEINSIIVVGDASEVVKVADVIARIDKPQPQVVIEARIIEVNKDALKELGVDWSDEINLGFQETGRPLDLSDNESASGSPFRISSFQRTPIQFNTIIKMLENQNKAKVLSNPRISTLNDKEAEIFVGDRLPYTVTTISGGVATTDVRFEEPGIRLKITPSIIDKDFVVIKVEPEVSFIFAFRGPDDQYPHTKKRHATAYVRVKNNQPFVLGGLLNQEDKKNLFKVPMLGDLPLLGNLFSYESRTIIDTELIITITPKIVYSEE